MATYTLSGNLGDLIGQPLAFPNGQPARAYLLPEQTFNIVDSQLRVGSLELTLDANDTFTQTGVSNGDYQVLVVHFDPEDRRPTSTTLPVTVSGDTTVSA